MKRRKSWISFWMTTDSARAAANGMKDRKERYQKTERKGIVRSRVFMLYSAGQNVFPGMSAIQKGSAHERNGAISASGRGKRRYDCLSAATVGAERRKRRTRG